MMSLYLLERIKQIDRIDNLIYSYINDKSCCAKEKLKQEYLVVAL